MKYSAYQEAVFDFGSNGQGHGAVISVAGSGKSTTGVELLTRFGSCDQGLFTSFTRTIVEDLDRKLRARGVTNAYACTYNTFGSRILNKYLNPRPRLLTDYPGQKTDMILKWIYSSPAGTIGDYYKYRNVIITMVSLFKNLAVLDVSDAEKQYDTIISEYDLDNDNCRDLFLETYAACLRREDIIDFDDQKFMPILLGMSIPQHDFVVIDEYQDTTAIESILMLRSCNGGRVVVFGDPMQAIYSFKGTVPDQIERFVALKSARVMPLSISYRCSQAVVAEAQKLCRSIEAAPGAAIGCVDRISIGTFGKMVRPGDMVLARTVAVLVESVLGLLGEGRAAHILGKDTQLEYLIEKSNPQGNDDVRVFWEALTSYYDKRRLDLLAVRRDTEALALEFRYSAIRALLPGCGSVSGLIRRIGTIFVEGVGAGICHMTVHRAKGLECDGNVFLLRPDLLPHPRSKNLPEERRLLYVAITRAKEGFYYVDNSTGNV